MKVEKKLLLFQLETSFWAHLRLLRREVVPGPFSPYTLLPGLTISPVMCPAFSSLYYHKELLKMESVQGVKNQRLMKTRGIQNYNINIAAAQLGKLMLTK